MIKRFFITIKYNNSIIQNKIAINSTDEELIKNVKNVRKIVYNETVINKKNKKNYSIYSWSIFKNIEDNQPFLKSNNWID